ncbi:MAG: hypothetical protein JRJ11_02910 [Deltaproteobacteria bacterium]|nr:hypothetical protein [Deltaproteobacteria bacterium]MBW1726574.1 hypothetical protein [Deltaproteobacteria bacterium]MBW1908483.1 hypothetical protein [Deltaproteobacteria bacterium]MBW2032889.1 hypothetical protein [Deltaproteobacteria bacterium]MBW2113868.1 hypothetical protein [Deltaproteobacteria bacterium]
MKNNRKYKQRTYVLGLCLIIFLFFTGNTLATNSKSLKLQNKIGAISALREKLITRHATAIELIDKLEILMIELKREIKSKQKQLKITSYQEATRNPRIDYNIKLIQQVLVYISGLKKKIPYLKTGNDELEFLYQQADDNLKIFETLNDMKIEKLLDRINHVSNKYESEANHLLIDIDNIALTSPEKIWDKIMISIVSP